MPTAKGVSTTGPPSAITESKAMATYELDNLLKDLRPAEFISLLAAEAYKEDVILETPHQTLERIRLFRRNLV